MAVKPYTSIGMADELSFSIIGRLTPSGRLSYSRSTYERMSFSASSMSEPHSNSSVTTDMLSFEVEVMFFSPSTLFSEFSMILVMLVSMSLALAPA